MVMMVPMANPEPRLGRAIGERLDALRRAHGWTQGQLVVKTKLDKSTVYQILAGARKDPPVGTVMRFAEAFGVGVDELIGLKPLQMPETPDAPADDSGRLEELERKLAVLSDLPGQVAAMAKLMAELSERSESRPSADTPKRSGKGEQKRSA